jgi:hypothetical protein
MLILFTTLLVPSTRIELVMAAYQAAVIPFNYKGITVVRPERFELPTAGFEDQNSIQLSYGRNIW